jgi:hypothetical protein
MGESQANAQVNRDRKGLEVSALFTGLLAILSSEKGCSLTRENSLFGSEEMSLPTTSTMGVWAEWTESGEDGGLDDSGALECDGDASAAGSVKYY